MSSPLTHDEIEEILAHVMHAIRVVMKAIRDGSVSHEDDINPYLLGKMDAIKSKHFSINGRVFKHRRGSANEEGTFGADILLVVDVLIRGKQMKKGVLIQAKMPGSFHGLKEQCKKMTSITKDSFVLIYNDTGFAFQRASIYTGDAFDLNDTYEDRDFFRHVLLCFIGDHRLDSINPDILLPIKPLVAMSFTIR